MILSRYDELYLFCDMGYYNYTPFSLVVHSRVSGLEHCFRSTKIVAS